MTGLGESYGEGRLQDWLVVAVGRALLSLYGGAAQPVSQSDRLDLRIGLLQASGQDRAGCTPDSVMPPD